MRKKIDDAYARITKDKQPFEQVARDVSLTETAAHGGHLGCLSEKTSPAGKELLDAIASLQAGRVSPVIETTHGFYILRFDAKLADSAIEREARLNIARRQGTRALIDDGARKLATDIIKSVKAGTGLQRAVDQVVKALPARALQDAASPEQSTSNAGKPPAVVTSSSFAQNGTPGPDFSPFSGIGQRVFALDKAGSAVADPVMTLRGPAVVVLVAKEAAKREDFEKQAESLMRELQETKSEAALQDTVYRLRHALGNKIEVAAEYKNPKIRGSED